MTSSTHFDVSVGVGVDAMRGGAAAAFTIPAFPIVIPDGEKSPVTTGHRFGDPHNKSGMTHWRSRARRAAADRYAERVVEKSNAGDEKRLSIGSVSCTFSGSSDKQVREVPGRAVRLAHLVTPDSTA